MCSILIDEFSTVIALQKCSPSWFLNPRWFIVCYRTALVCAKWKTAELCSEQPSGHNTIFIQNLVKFMTFMSIISYYQLKDLLYTLR